MHGHVVATRVFDTAQHEHLRPAGRHLQHLLVGDLLELLRIADDARVGGEDPVHVGVDLADIGLQRRGQRDRGGIGTTAPQRGDIFAVLADALETRHQDDGALVEGFPEPAGGHIDDLGLTVHRRGDDTGLGAGERPRLGAETVDGHGDQRVGDAFTGGEQHIHLPRGRRGRDLLGQVEQFIGGIAHS